MKPYLEVKVVKVKKEDLSLPYCPIYSIPINECEYYKKVQRKKAERAYKEGNWSGKHWVNGENLDKIKFPCFCSFKYGTGTHYGIITKTRLDFDGGHFTLHSIWEQHSSFSSVKSYSELGSLIEIWDIHILKGKIILFEEE